MHTAATEKAESLLMKIKEIQVKDILTKSNLPGADYVVNPYVGCQHGCKYCYAEFMKRFTDHKENWGEFVDIKINAAETIKDPKKYHGKTIFFSSVTDPYHPIEAKYKLTRKILEKLVPGQPIIDILTKSRLMTRDIDVFKKFDSITIGISLSTLDDDLSRILEPMAASPKLRIEALRKCKEAGLRMWVFVSPIIPYVTDVDRIIRKAKGIVDYIMFENLNLRGHNTQRMIEFIKKYRPDKLEEFKKVYTEKSDYWDNVEKDIKKICRDENIKCEICFHHGGFKK